ncbi:methyltransferase domain-containing protein [Candidatus Gottesmanbacteria bacterium]|nr:methyltransferase domain-containing protein [Candidatus Gottesmanbacteria bacterium]
MRKYLSNIYQTRYNRVDEKKKEAIWQVLCSDYLQKYINETDSVLDIAAGHCEFINNIKCSKKYALDIDVRIRKYAHNEVEVIIGSADKIPAKLTGKIDKIFMGCFLEHLPDKQAIINVLLGIKKILKPKGKLIILNPNIRFSTADYWDYFDHLTPVSDRSVVEVLEALGFKIEVCLPKFVPNTIKDSLPKNPLLVKIYLHLPFLFPIFGRQMFIVATK